MSAVVRGTGDRRSPAKKRVPHGRDGCGLDERDVNGHHNHPLNRAGINCIKCCHERRQLPPIRICVHDESSGDRVNHLTQRRIIVAPYDEDLGDAGGAEQVDEP